jgi:hypothetical protein
MRSFQHKPETRREPVRLRQQLALDSLQQQILRCQTLHYAYMHTAEYFPPARPVSTARAARRDQRQFSLPFDNAQQMRRARPYDATNDFEDFMTNAALGKLREKLVGLTADAPCEFGDVLDQ